MILPVEYRSVIKFLLKKGVRSSKSDLRDKKKVYGFRLGRDNVIDEPRSGRPLEVNYLALGDPVRKLIEIDRKIGIEE